MMLDVPRWVLINSLLDQAPMSSKQEHDDSFYLLKGFLGFLFLQ